MSDIFLLTLKTFSATGGIEKVCKVAGKALFEFGARCNKSVSVASMYDTEQDAYNNPYFPNEIFSGYGINKVKFILDSVKSGRKAKVVILSHINLLLIGYLIKKISPKTKIVLFAHGIEIWDRLGIPKNAMLKVCDKILSVSSFTSNKVMVVQGIPGERCAVLNNCLDPYLTLPANTAVDNNLWERYGFTKENKILFTLSRLSSKERYKGYEAVLEALSLLKKDRPELRYLIAGSYDDEEKEMLDQKVKHLGLEGMVVIPGFLHEDEIPRHFKMADLYVMPSRKEGFGIVFIEAMYYGLPVIAGNEDGSTDALLDGRLGKLVKPQDVESIRESIETMLNDPAHFHPEHSVLMENFGYESYKRKFETYLEQLLSN